MPTFRVYHIATISHIEEIDVETAEEAYDQAEEGHVTLCHHCTKEWEPDGDSDVYQVEDAEGNVLLQRNDAGELVAPDA